MKIKIRNISTNPLPVYETEHAAGMDLRADIDHPIVIKAMMRCIIPTGLFIELPHGHEAQIRPRSGLAMKHGITVLNSPGTIDADYRGEIKIILINLSENDYEIKKGDRICQMVISKYEQIEWDESKLLNESERGIGGFGHTGER